MRVIAQRVEGVWQQAISYLANNTSFTLEDLRSLVCTKSFGRDPNTLMNAQMATREEQGYFPEALQREQAYQSRKLESRPPWSHSTEQLRRHMLKLWVQDDIIIELVEIIFRRGEEVEIPHQRHGLHLFQEKSIMHIFFFVVIVVIAIPLHPLLLDFGWITRDQCWRHILFLLIIILRAPEINRKGVDRRVRRVFLCGRIQMVDWRVCIRCGDPRSLRWFRRTLL